MASFQVDITLAVDADLNQILDLQRLCYQSEAALYYDYSIPPLQESLTDLANQMPSTTILKATDGGRIIGSVRGKVLNGTCFIGRLVVHPDEQNRGIGKRLMAAIEQEFSTARRYELFTGGRSSKNLSLYQRLGYRECRREAVNSSLTLVYMEKISTGTSPGTSLER